MSKSNNKNMAEMFEETLEILKFMIEHAGENDIIFQFISFTNEAYSSNNIVGMKYLYKDTREWATGLSVAQIKSLNLILINKFDTSIKFK